MQDPLEESPIVPEPLEPKKEYHAPQVRDYGTIQELTLSNATDGEPYPDSPSSYVTSY